ncbi:transmembrane protein 110, like isoform 2-T2 [Menidia menidia]
MHSVCTENTSAGGLILFSHAGSRSPTLEDGKIERPWASVHVESVKRFREPIGIRRPWRIWFFDTSKQAIGALFIHFANVFLSTLTKEDPCSLYLMNFLLDATLGMLVIWLAVMLVSKLVEYKQWTLLMFGEYGDPPQAAAWLGQGGIYLLIMVLEKGVVSLVLLIPGWSKLQEVLLSYIANPQLELALVMLIVPFIVNSIMFWVVDSLTMRKYKTTKSLEDGALEKAESLPGVDSEESRVLLANEMDTEEASEGEEDPNIVGPVYAQCSGRPLRPSWVVV